MEEDQVREHFNEFNIQEWAEMDWTQDFWESQPTKFQDHSQSSWKDHLAQRGSWELEESKFLSLRKEKTTVSGTTNLNSISGKGDAAIFLDNISKQWRTK